jgi:hypothetical protein
VVEEGVLNELWEWLLLTAGDHQPVNRLIKGGASRDLKGHGIECMHLYCVCVFAFSVS